MYRIRASHYGGWWIRDQPGVNSVIGRSAWLFARNTTLSPASVRASHGAGRSRSVVQSAALGRRRTTLIHEPDPTAVRPTSPTREACPEDQGGPKAWRIATRCSRRLRSVGGATTAAIQPMSSWSASSPSAQLTSGVPTGPEAAQAAWATSCSSQPCDSWGAFLADPALEVGVVGVLAAGLLSQLAGLALGRGPSRSRNRDGDGAAHDARSKSR